MQKEHILWRVQLNLFTTFNTLKWGYNQIHVIENMCREM